MSYRRNSFDPSASRPDPLAPPARPYDGRQWVGIAVGIVGLFLTLLWFADRFGGWGSAAAIPGPALMLVAFGASFMVCYRRADLPGRARAGDRQLWEWWLGLVMALCGAAIAALELAADA